MTENQKALLFFVLGILATFLFYNEKQEKFLADKRFLEEACEDIANEYDLVTVVIDPSNWERKPLKCMVFNGDNAFRNLTVNEEEYLSISYENRSDGRFDDM
jgi:hypothetical protein